MIKYTFITTIAVLLVYALFIRVRPSLGASQNQWQDNVIKAQKYIYNDAERIESVIVGSSLSNKLVMDSLPGMKNLSFGGESIYDGLNVILLKQNVPKYIFIEMNCALRKENETFTTSLNSPILYPVRKIIPSLREDKQPIAILGNLINNNITKKIVPKLKGVITTKQDKKIEDNDAVFNKMLDLQIKNYLTIPDQDLISACFDNLFNKVNDLTKQGVEVIFYEMPVNSRLVDLPKAKIIREEFFKIFPTSKYKYIPLPENSDSYITIDGIHLRKDEALIYTSFFKTEVKNYIH